tara:strand:+ start:962 stop:1231 length:270 start_codon:yes stop_codon:yes gene_type:complete
MNLRNNRKLSIMKKKIYDFIIKTQTILISLTVPQKIIILLSSLVSFVLLAKENYRENVDWYLEEEFLVYSSLIFSAYLIIAFIMFDKKK